MPRPITPRRSVRVPEQLWRRALDRATSRGETLSEALRRLLEQYASETKP